MKYCTLVGTIPALALALGAVLGTAPDAQAAPVAGSVVVELNGDYETRVVNPGSTNPGYEIDIEGQGTLFDTLSSQIDEAPGWVVSSEGSVTGNWTAPPSPQLANGVTVNRSLSQTIPGPLSFNDLGNLPVAPGGTVTYATSLALLQDGRFDPTGSGFTFGGGQGILPDGDTITGTIDFNTGDFDLTVAGNDAVESLVTYTDFLDSLGIAPPATLTDAFGSTDNWDRSVLAFLPDSGTFSSTTTISAVPIPASLPLLLAGLGGLGLFARGKRKAA